MEKEGNHKGGIRCITREGVVEAAGNLFLKHGIKSITMDDVAHLLGMSKRTLYELFSSKEALLLEFVTTGLEKKQKYIEHQIAQDDSELTVILKVLQLRSQDAARISPQFVKEIKTYKSLLETFTQHRKEMEQKEVEFFERGVQKGFFLSGIDFAFHNKLLHMQLERIGQLFDEPVQVVQAQNEAIFIYLRGIATVEGQKVIENFRNNNMNNNN